ncbi:hypothetical protein WA1_43360 [Scytonema hofmannii PCC 7110]|uniref:Uncharacterized protein n=1 Tax=Scytonema hofmannii PCC 7110 TaxID=128403 RepID=A0A139WVS0_9CYAN|nr:hypothetical protein [Scytonema hofmannii]KYC36532.1 hypothetical protein WA1_43360 [Scytonema hofmannii PCC 7110]
MLKRLLFLFSLTVTSTGAVFFFFWYQATQLPDWYKNSQTQQVSPPTVANLAPPTDQTEQLQKAQKQQAQKQVLHKISDRLKGSKAKREVQLDADEVNALIDSGIAQSTDKSRLAQAVVSTKTQIENGKISAGAVIDLRAIPFNELQKGEQIVVSKLLSAIPILRYRPVYVEVEGKPTLRNKQVSLDDTTRIKLGNISFSLLDLSKRFGFSEERLNQQVAKKLENLPVEVDEVEVVGDRLVVRGSAGNKKGTRNTLREST